jgi:hypothetical protein
MKFIVRKASDKEFEQEQDVSTLEDMMALTNGLQHPLIIFPRQLRPPFMLICDDGSTGDRWRTDRPDLESVMLTATAMVKALKGK